MSPLTDANPGRRRSGTLLVALGVLFGLPLLAVVAVFAINATDESLSEATQALLKEAPPPAPSERNGFVELLGARAPQGVDPFEAGVKLLAEYARPGGGDAKTIGALSLEAVRGRDLPPCWRTPGACVEHGVALPALAKLLEEDRAFLARYRSAQAKPEFSDLLEVNGPAEGYPFQWGSDLTAGQQLSLLEASIAFRSGNRERAVAIVEAERAFAGKVAGGARSLLAKMVAFGMLDRVALFASNLARALGPADRALLARLGATAAMPSREMTDTTAALRRERAQAVRWMQTRAHARLTDETYEMFRQFGMQRTRSRWDAIMPYLYRPRHSVNLYVARGDLILAAAAEGPVGFAAAVARARKAIAAMEPGALTRALVNPVGRDHFYLDYDVADYVGRSYGVEAVQALARLQIRLREAGIAAPQAIDAALAGPLGQEHRNPFTGRPLRYDRERDQLGLEIRAMLVSGVARGALEERDGALWLER